MYYIYSTSTADYEIKGILINGRANTYDKNGVYIDYGVTKVDDKQYDILKEHPFFIQTVDKGFITVSKTKARNPHKNMEEGDNSQPLNSRKMKKGKGSDAMTLEKAMGMAKISSGKLDGS